MSGADVFGTAALRRTVLQGWSASVHRFREDANAEESLAVGGYADRVLIELIANAVDAARSAGEPGRVLVRWLDAPGGPELRVANNGAPLTAAGVAGLATLRASAKRDNADGVGHFGVGFTAVLAVTDAPTIMSTTGGVVFDRAATADAVSELGSAELDAEVATRTGHVPALRLPWPVVTGVTPPPAGFVTEVRLPIREDSLDRVREAVAGAGPALFWALPGLSELDIALPGRAPRRWRRRAGPPGITVLNDGHRDLRFRISTSSGTVPAALLIGRPVEERNRDRWLISWIQPLEDTDPKRSRYLGAPTPTDEQLTLPADLVGTFPVDDTRRRIAAGPLADHLLREAARGYLDLVMSAPVEQRFGLIPAGGFPVGPVDAVLRTEVLSGLATLPMLRTATGDAIAPPEARILDGIGESGTALLAEAVPGLLRSAVRAADLDALRLLGVRTMPLSEAVSALSGLDRGPKFWWQVYEALADRPSDELADLPVPLAGGGRRIGVRGCLIPDPAALPAELIERTCSAAPSIPVVHPGAAHPLLTRLGAVPADADALLGAPALAVLYQEFREALNDREPQPDELIELAALALDLVAAGGRLSGSGIQVVLTDDQDEAWPATELLAPDARWAAVLGPAADLPVIAAYWLERYPLDVLGRVGVRTGLPVITVSAPDGPDADLPDLDQWWSEVIGDTQPPDSYTAVADLDLIDENAWPAVLDMISTDRKARETLASRQGLSYTGWWLSRFARVAGLPLGQWRGWEASELTGLYDELPIQLDPALARAVGVLADLDEAIRRDPADVLRRYADPARRLSANSVLTLTTRLAWVLRADARLILPDLVRTMTGDAVDPERVLVLDLPWLAQVLPSGVVMPGGGDPELVAEAFEVDLASERLEFELIAEPSRVLPDEVIRPVAEGLGLADRALALRCAPGLAVRLSTAAAAVRVGWWGIDGGAVVDGTPAGIGRAVAYLGGRWADRQLAIAIAGSDDSALTEFGL